MYALKMVAYSIICSLHYYDELAVWREYFCEQGLDNDRRPSDFPFQKFHFTLQKIQQSSRRFEACFCIDEFF